MADNSTLDPGTGGDTIRDKDRAGVKTQIVGLDLGIGGSETLMNGSMPVTAASLPLPTGAATAAKQPALGTAGSASADVVSVQGIASMTPLLVNGSGVTQPISDAGGTLTVDAPAGTPVFVRLSDGSAAITTLPVSLASLPALAAGSNEIGGVNQVKVAGTAVSVNSGAKDAGTQRVILASDQTVVPISDNSSSLTVDAPVGTPVFTTVTPSTTGGWSKIKYAAQTTTVQTPKGTAGNFGGYYVYNPNASVAYVQVFDVATATTVTLGTTVPDMIFAIPAGSAANLELTNGVNMALGIKLACTTTATGLTAPGTGLDMTVFFK